MKITCDRQELYDAVSNVSRAVSSKSTIQALEGVLMKAADRLYLSCYDLETGITTDIAAAVERRGEIVLSARLLADMLRRMDGERVEIDCDEKNLTAIRSGRTEYTILAIPSEDFPSLPTISDTQEVAVPQNHLKSMIDQTLFAIAQTDAKPVQTGAKFILEDGSLTVVSVDGYRMAVRKEALSGQQEATFIVPGRTLQEASKLLDPESESPAELYLAKKHIIFHINGYSLISRLLEGEFLDYKAAIPAGNATTVTVNVRAFANSVERSSLMINDRLRSCIRLSFTEEGIGVSCSTALGKVSDAVPASLTGPNVEMAFNNRYLLDALKACDCDQVKLSINGSLSPLKILPMEGDSFLFLVVPVRFKAD